MTVKEACEKYIESGRNRRSITTTEGYERIIRTRFKHFMTLRLKDVDDMAANEALENEYINA